MYPSTSTTTVNVRHDLLVIFDNDVNSLTKHMMNATLMILQSAQCIYREILLARLSQWQNRFIQVATSPTTMVDAPSQKSDSTLITCSNLEESLHRHHQKASQQRKFKLSIFSMLITLLPALQSLKNLGVLLITLQINM